MANNQNNSHQYRSDINLYLTASLSHAQLCWTLSNPMNCNPPGSSVHEISQARILEQAAISSSRASSEPGIEIASPALAGDLPATGKVISTRETDIPTAIYTFFLYYLSYFVLESKFSLDISHGMAAHYFLIHHRMKCKCLSHGANSTIICYLILLHNSSQASLFLMYLFFFFLFFFFFVFFIQAKISELL